MPPRPTQRRFFHFEDRRVLCWWVVLNTLTAMNIVWWATTAPSGDLVADLRAALPTVLVGVGESSDDNATSADWYRVTQWRLSGLYAAVCAYRALLPRIDLERFVLVDHWLSAVVLGRGAATVAEISFAVQCSLALQRVSGFASADVAMFPQLVAAVIPFVLTAAQGFCWAGVVTKSHLWHAIEETLWMLSYAAVGQALWSLLPALDASPAAAALFAPVRIALAACAVFVVFMATVDVPMYVVRWRRDTGRHHMRPLAGFRDAVTRRVPTSTWANWREEVAWLTGYFVLGVAGSISLQFVPGP